MLPLLFSGSACAADTQSITNPTSVLSIFLSLLLVVAIIFALAYVMRRFNVTHGGSGQMKVVASMVAGSKERIMVIEVGDEQHLVGVTSHTISHLSKLENKLTPKSSGDNSGQQFKDKLVKAMAGKINPAIKQGDSHE
ncbi:flagellar biosynthetic protein FliO [Salinimonas lutimaris]|uniref:flagellar biosynthetic protein FliO n=1 Tax=Salinimonas lutimaris TaxID=914153 RepID=UPI0010C11D33|nr:flagellar biosynthetic protein FliO [Salinimonas lutimaris]